MVSRQTALVMWPRALFFLPLIPNYIFIYSDHCLWLLLETSSLSPTEYRLGSVASFIFLFFKMWGSHCVTEVGPEFISCLHLPSSWHYRHALLYQLILRCCEWYLILMSHDFQNQKTWAFLIVHMVLLLILQHFEGRGHLWIDGASVFPLVW